MALFQTKGTMLISATPEFWVGSEKISGSHLSLKTSSKILITRKTPKRVRILSKICLNDKKDHSHGKFFMATKR